MFNFLNVFKIRTILNFEGLKLSLKFYMTKVENL